MAGPFTDRTVVCKSRGQLGPELSVLRMLGLFDRPADEKALGALLKSPAIPGLTETLTDLYPTEWRSTEQPLGGA